MAASRGRPRTGKRKEWTVEEEIALTALIARGLTYDEIAALMKRTRNSVLVKAGRIGAGNAAAVRKRKREAVNPAEVEASFWNYVDRSGGPQACWPWTGPMRPNGYGSFYERGAEPSSRYWQAHRFAYRAATGAHPGGRFVCHACDNPPCCNPAHLWLGDAKSNSHDAMSKGRHVPPPRTDWAPRLSERAHHWARLTRAEAIEVRRRAAGGENQAKIAAEFGINSRTVSKIKLGQRRRFA